MKVHLLASAACLGLCIGHFGFAGGASAQERASAPQSDCSGLSCFFGGGQRQPTAAEAQALQNNQRAAEAEGAGGPASKSSPKRTAKASSGSPDAAKPKTADASDTEGKAKRKKSVHTVTIAAEGPEAKKLQSLAAALPKEKIKIVKTRGDSDKTKSDFTISNALEPSSDGEKAKLFTEQLHIVASGAVKSVADLDGKVVSFGPDKSPGQAAARKAFAALNVKVNETPLEVDNALDGLSSGDVDAVVMLAPQPIDRLKTVQADGVHLVSWPEGGSLPSGATAATIDAGAYPGLAKQGETVRAVGVDAMLTMSAKGAKQDAAKSFLKSLSQNADALTKRGFDLLRADLGQQSTRHLASADKS